MIEHFDRFPYALALEQYNREHPATSYSQLYWPVDIPTPLAYPYSYPKRHDKCLGCGQPIPEIYGYTITGDRERCGHAQEFNRHAQKCERITSLTVWGLVSLYLDNDPRFADLMINYPIEMERARDILQTLFDP